MINIYKDEYKSQYPVTKKKKNIYKNLQKSRYGTY